MNEFNWIIPIPNRPLSLEIRGTDTALTAIRILRQETASASAPPGSLAAEAARQLTQYFNGTRQTFDLPLDPKGTPFQKRVLMALVRVPFGETLTYGELAARANSPKASRAVGGVMAKNPLPIVIPCHRVLAAGGRIGGFTGGLDLKRMLLAIEGHPLGS